MMTVLRSVSLIFALLAALSACGGSATSVDLEFSDVWSRQPAEGQPVSAIYATVTNTGGSDVRIVGASADVSGRVELHESLMEDGLMTMRESEEGFVVPAGGTFVFEPGGPHVMLMGIDAATYPSDHVEVTFEFDVGEPQTMHAAVREIGSSTMSGDMNHSDHEDMDHSDHDDADQ